MQMIVLCGKSLLFCGRKSWKKKSTESCLMSPCADSMLSKYVAFNDIQLTLKHVPTKTNFEDTTTMNYIF